MPGFNQRITQTANIYPVEMSSHAPLLCRVGRPWGLTKRQPTVPVPVPTYLMHTNISVFKNTYPGYIPHRPSPSCLIKSVNFLSILFPYSATVFMNLIFFIFHLYSRNLLKRESQNYGLCIYAYKYFSRSNIRYKQRVKLLGTANTE